MQEEISQRLVDVSDEEREKVLAKVGEWILKFAILVAIVIDGNQSDVWLNDLIVWCVGIQTESSSEE